MESKAAERPVVLITGSTGLIGACLAEACAPHYRVIGLDVKRPQREVADTDFIECDVTKDESVTQALTSVHTKYGNRIASVIHLAA